MDSVSCAFEPGAVTAILGPNGSGKTTLLRVLLGLLAPSSGEVLLGGRRLDSYTPAERASRVAYVPQRSEMLFPYTLREVLSMVSGRGSGRHGAARVEEAMQQAGLGHASEMALGSLSAGQQQRALVARATLQLGEGALSGSVLLADEPVAAMDPRFSQSTMEQFAGLAERGATVVVVLHDLQLASAYATHALLLAASGRLESCGPIEAAMTSQTLSKLYGAEFSAVTTGAGVRSYIAEFKPRRRVMVPHPK